MENWIAFYHSLGLNVIPCLPRSKKPAIRWKDYQQRMYDGSFAANCNYAALCGRSSQNLVVLDFDCHDTDLVCKIIPNAFEDTLCVLTGSEKYHVYLRVPELPDRTRRLNGYNGYHLDIQAHGAYVVCPPSVHPDTGKEYRIISRARRIKTYDLREILVSIEKLGFKVAATKVSQILHGVETGNRNVAAFRYARYLITNVRLDPSGVLCELQRWNQLNKPPLADTEIEVVWKSALKYGDDDNFAKNKLLEYEDKRKVKCSCGIIITMADIPAHIKQFHPEVNKVSLQ